jgi:geranylgeranyl diphosphate synthase type II
MDFKSTLKNYQDQINQAIPTLLPTPNTEPPEIHQAMLYSMQAGGKRLRPVLLLGANNLYPSKTDPLPAAVAVECLHTYSLIHDDLPCMDNSPLRRGLPTSHIKFDEATALLAGDALLTYSFLLLSKHYNHIPQTACEMIYDLSLAAGSTHLIGGQIEDLKHHVSPSNNQRLDFIHQNKTSALISASLTIGLRMTTATEEKIAIARKLGLHIGLAFQIIDDILDITSSADYLGKTPGLDIQNNTLTYPKIYGIKTSSEKAAQHTLTAITLCKELGGQNEFLLEFIDSLQHRLV